MTPEARRAVYLKQRAAVPPETRRRWARASTLRRKYGLTIGQFELLLSAQFNTCAICYDAFYNGLCEPVVDHDHETGRVRGLLCHRCNHALGHLRDSPEIARRAGLYLQGRRDYV